MTKCLFYYASKLLSIKSSKYLSLDILDNCNSTYSIFFKTCFKIVTMRFYTFHNKATVLKLNHLDNFNKDNWSNQIKQYNNELDCAHSTGIQWRLNEGSNRQMAPFLEIWFFNLVYNRLENTYRNVMGWGRDRLG